MRRTLAFLTLLAVAAPVWAQTATELKKELLPKIKKAQAEGKDLGEAGVFYKQGDEALKNGLMDEALEAFQKAKAAMPAE